MDTNDVMRKKMRQCNTLKSQVTNLGRWGLVLMMIGFVLLPIFEFTFRTSTGYLDTSVNDYTYISKANPTVNYGHLSYMRIGVNNLDYYESYIRFDIPAIDNVPSYRIYDVKLSLEIIQRAGGNGLYTFELWDVTDAWLGSDFTYEDRASLDWYMTKKIDTESITTVINVPTNVTFHSNVTTGKFASYIANQHTRSFILRLQPVSSPLSVVYFDITASSVKLQVQYYEMDAGLSIAMWIIPISVFLSGVICAILTYTQSVKIITQCNDIIGYQPIQTRRVARTRIQRL